MLSHRSELRSQTAQAAVNRAILDPRNAELLTLVKAARNGAVYGAKVRFPHALVMVFLFRSGTLRKKLALVLKATRQHARNLALFAFLYKTFMLLLRHTPRPPRAGPAAKEPGYDSFLAGLVGGYVVFGRGMQSSVNQQIVIYVFARVVLGLAKIVVQESGVLGAGVQDGVRGAAWPVFAAVSWGAVMWLYRWRPEMLQPSLRSSMKYM